MRDTQKKFYKKLLGRRGERRAEKYLKKQGYTLLERNYIATVGEADLIMSDGETIVFIEVKTRSSDAFGMPSQAVDGRKQSKYHLIASEYLLKNNLDNADLRFDVVEILKKEINHIKNAF